ncbi:phosphatase PAP2 family protein [Pontibacter vulgaris]|uniref:phosphatase PAP2 family protein n=1 Tax=Pontibacter vulgaris TaxID=2905679 RepID=UPI001FA80A03|nr:phosphatase PAP2 family protein [Pontibacter vulgaris]
MYIYATPSQGKQWHQAECPVNSKTCDTNLPANCAGQHEAKAPQKGLATASILLLILSLFTGFAAQAQTSQETSVVYKSISPATNHYKTIGATDAAAKGGNKEGVVFPTKDFRRGVYLKLRNVYLDVPIESFKIKPYPANSSAQTRAELDFLLELQQKRTAKDIARTDTMANMYHDPFIINLTDPDYRRNVKSLFYVGRNLGPWFTPEKLPITSYVLQNVIQDATYYLYTLKVKYNRARPYQLEPALKNLEAPGHASYPSDHSSFSHVHAYLLSYIFPEYKTQFMGNAYDMAFSREIRGVNYPSDSEAGKEFAQQFIEQLMKSKKFQADLEAMKTELARVKSQNT